MAYKSIDGGLDIKELLKSCNESEDDMVNWSPSIRENKLYEKCNAAIINEQQTLTSKSVMIAPLYYCPLVERPLIP